MKVIFRRVMGRIKVFRVKDAHKTHKNSGKIRRALRRQVEGFSTRFTKNSQRVISGRISVPEKGLFHIKQNTMCRSKDRIGSIRNQVTQKTIDKGLRSSDTIAEYTFVKSTATKGKKNLIWHSGSSEVDKPFQRKGITTQVYNFFEKSNGINLRAGATNSKSGAFWKKRYKMQGKKGY